MVNDGALRRWYFNGDLIDTTSLYPSPDEFHRIDMKVEELERRDVPQSSSSFMD